MDCTSGADSAMDLSLRNYESSSSGNIVKPIPRPAWSIVWYQNLWNISNPSNHNNTTIIESGSMKNKVETSSTTPLSILNCFNTNSGSDTRHSGYNFPLTLPHQNDERCNRDNTTLYASSQVGFNHCHRYKANLQQGFQENHNTTGVLTNERSADCSYDSSISVEDEDGDENESKNSENIVVTTTDIDSISERDESRRLLQRSIESGNLMGRQNAIILDVACCDGPVQFKRISNPNFAVTVEHNEIRPSTAAKSSTERMSVSPKEHKTGKIESRRRPLTTDDGRNTNKGNDKDLGSTTKTYLCIYCNQSFKSLFCYQKHKKRHLNPVSVDITTTMENSTSQQRTSNSSSSCSGEGVVGVGSCRSSNNNSKANITGLGNGGGVGIVPDNNTKAKTKDLNVQFFPCKKCGSKFPSYYFVHKHRKICH